MPETIKFHQPLKAARVTGSWNLEVENRIKSRESASYQKGMQDGQRSLGEQLLAQRSDLIQLQSGILGSLKNAVPQVAKQCEEHLITLTVQLVERIVGAAAVSQESIASAVRDALAQVEEATSYTILLHPEDLTLLEHSTDSLLPRAGSSEQIAFKTDATISRGGCVVETPFGIIDARRETKLELLKSALVNS
ncbi:MAG: FliH/SctL family protein [Verrucomicrobiota bacterium]|nr:FliH/SctL family protein [Verrucomicrobiota bacterium]